uniref:SCA7 domain-containing protein n=1 Tax=Strongyloides papillosus TaxID=174720 RepID=A0A0N5B230_STREA
MALIYASAVNKRIGSSGLSKNSGNNSHSHGTKNNKKKCSLEHHQFTCEDLDDNQINYFINSNKKKRSAEEMIIVCRSKDNGCRRSISVCREHPLGKIGYQKVRECISTSSSSRNCSRGSRDDSKCCRKHSKNRSNKKSTGSSSKKSSYEEQTKTIKDKSNNRKISVPPISSPNYIEDDNSKQFKKTFSLQNNDYKSLCSYKQPVNECLCQRLDTNFVTKLISPSHNEKIIPSVIELNGRRKSLSYDNITAFLENNNEGIGDGSERNEMSAFQKMKNRFKKWKL